MGEEHWPVGVIDTHITSSAKNNYKPYNIIGEYNPPCSMQLYNSREREGRNPTRESPTYVSNVSGGPVRFAVPRTRVETTAIS